MNDFCLKGAKEICGAVGENPKNMADLVNSHGLPAWKRDVRGTWRALPEDLRRWIRDQRDRHISSYIYKPREVQEDKTIEPPTSGDARDHGCMG